MDENLSPENRSGRAIGATVALLILIITATVLRLTSRKLSGAGLWWDDWLVLAALPWVLAENLITFWSVRYGLGQHQAFLPADATTKILRIYYVGEILYVVSFGLVKFSIIFLYRRIFPQRTLYYILWAVGLAVLGWTISIGGAIIFQCTPIHKTWDVTVPGHCISVPKFFLGNAIPTIITDVVLISIPLPLIWNLQISKVQKVSLCAVFLSGGFVCIVSLYRLIDFVLHVVTFDIPWNFTGIQIWSIVEVSVAYVAACLPSMRYLLKFLNPNRVSTKGDTGKPSAAVLAWKHEQNVVDNSSTGRFRILDENQGNSSNWFSTRATGGETDPDLEMDLPKTRIHVKKEIDQQ